MYNDTNGGGNKMNKKMVPAAVQPSLNSNPGGTI